MPDKQTAKTDQKPATLRDRLEGQEFQDQIARVLPKHLTADRFIRVAATTIMRVPKLAECDQVSFFNALLSLSQLGLEPDGRNAHLIPFNNRKRGVVECQLIIDYKGLVDLAMRSGTVANIHADKVCENDDFQVNLGEITAHKIDYKQPRGKAYAYYALVRFKDGTSKCEIMPSEDIESIRKRSKAATAGPWVTDYDEMAKKTAFRRLSKWIQLSPEFRSALEFDADRLEERRFDAAQKVQAMNEPINPFALPEPEQAALPEPPAKKKESKAKPADAVEIGADQAQIAFNLADEDIQEIDFLKWLSANHKIKLGGIAEMKDNTAAELLEDWGTVSETLRS